MCTMSPVKHSELANVFFEFIAYAIIALDRTTAAPAPFDLRSIKTGNRVGIVARIYKSNKMSPGMHYARGIHTA